MAKRPAFVELAYTLENHRINEVMVQTKAKVDYRKDTNAGLTGIQNKIRGFGPPYNPASEKVYAFFRAVSRDNWARTYRWVKQHTTATLKTGGGINASVQTMDILESSQWVDRTRTSWYVGDKIMWDDGNREISTITSITPGSPNDTWGIIRGHHGTSGEAHALNATFRKIKSGTCQQL